MPADNENLERPLAETAEHSKRATEFIFIVAVGFIVLAAFAAALGYDPISARAPLCIMAPLLILIGVQFNRCRKATEVRHVSAELQLLVTGPRQRFRAVLSLIGWMALLLMGIYIAGHYAGMAIFLLLMLRVVAKESLRLSIVLTVLVTFGVYLLFENVFNIELYRGLLHNAIMSRLG